MNQLTQKLKEGKINIVEVPIPELMQGEILVRNFYSCISSGTESSTVKAARKGYIGKAKERPEQVKQVINKLRTQGFVQTYRAVMKKLDALSPLGYSCVGQVIDVASDVKEFSIGDYVACGGGTASHAEIVSVSENLCIKISPETDLKQAAYNTVGAIALQGVRQADLHLGECCAVIGLGLIGQLTCILLRASGIKVVAIDINPRMVEIAATHCADLAFKNDDPAIEQRIITFSNGMGCDAVIITAASSSLDPINFAGAIARKKGNIVIVGAVPTGFNREPYYYNKELTIKMSCSYGPGRYDPVYEEKNIDYPYAYVRWTEKRNMQAFQDLIATKKIDICYLTTHVFKLNEADKAYDMILDKSEPYIGLLIEYDITKKIGNRRIEISNARKLKSNTSDDVSIGFIGAGSFAQGSLLPNIPKTDDVKLKGVMTTTSTTSKSAAERFGFEFCTCKDEDILDNQDINTIFIATRHNSHSQYVLKALKAGKHVFVEKPLCLTNEELEEIKNYYKQANNQQQLLVGYNRRFAPLTEMLKTKLGREPMAMNYRINAGTIPSDSWIQDMQTGGGRILGEVCHFVDYLTYICGSLPASVYACAMETPNCHQDTLCITLRYQNGSVGNISYFANGAKKLSKEYIEIYQSGISAILNDFSELTVYGANSPVRKKLLTQDKGHRNEVHLFIDSVKKGGLSIIPFEQIYSTSLVCLRALDSLQTGNVMLL